MPLVLYVARLLGKCLFDRVFSSINTPLGAEGSFAFLLSSPPILCPCHTLLFTESLSASMASVIASPSLHLESVLCYHPAYLLGSQGKARRPRNKSGPWRVPRTAQTIKGSCLYTWIHRSKRCDEFWHCLGGLDGQSSVTEEGG